MINFLQINLNHCWVAQQLVFQTALELGSDVIIASDQYSTPADSDSWSVSEDGRAAVVVMRTPP